MIHKALVHEPLYSWINRVVSGHELIDEFQESEGFVNATIIAYHRRCSPVRESGDARQANLQAGDHQ